jgi:hypothetical protein
MFEFNDTGVLLLKSRITVFSVRYSVHESSSPNSSETTDTDQNHTCTLNSGSSFLYTTVHFNKLKVSALIDTGSSVNIISEFNDTGVLLLKSRITLFSVRYSVPKIIGLELILRM